MAILSTLAFAQAGPEDMVAPPFGGPSPWQIEGSTLCPTPAEVSVELARVAPRRSAAAPAAEVARLTDEGRAIRLRLVRVDGAIVGERTIEAVGSCADRAISVAVVIATWQSELDSGLAPEGPVLPRGRAAGSGGARLKAAVWLVGPRPSRLAAGGALGIDAEHASGLGFKAEAWGMSARTEPFAADHGGGARWARFGIGLGPRFAIRSSAGTIASVFACVEAARLRVAGEGFPATLSDASWDIGARGGVELGLRRGAWTPSLGLAAMYWPRSQAAVARGVEGTVTLPSIDVVVSLGIAWELGP
ncbi:MAG TPA: hypothetical protein VIU64_18000 [Polyangia bacterium]